MFEPYQLGPLKVPMFLIEGFNDNIRKTELGDGVFGKKIGQR
jgi:hypothetical protein